jgi:hypothetical protein
MTAGLYDRNVSPILRIQRISPLTASPRLAVNPPNAMLNYLYAVLESESRLALAALGLDARFDSGDVSAVLKRKFIPFIRLWGISEFIGAENPATQMKDLLFPSSTACISHRMSNLGSYKINSLATWSNKTYARFFLFTAIRRQGRSKSFTFLPFLSVAGITKVPKSSLAMTCSATSGDTPGSRAT